MQIRVVLRSGIIWVLAIGLIIALASVAGAQPNERRCFLPVTFTQQGWHDFCSPDNPVVPGGMVYNRFRFAFSRFTYYGNVYPNRLIIGGKYKIIFEGTTLGLSRLCAFLPQESGFCSLMRNYYNPVRTEAGDLASQAAALLMNIAYNDERLMPRTRGYDLENFMVASGPLKGKTVGQVLDIANLILGGAPPCMFGLAHCGILVGILDSINANYEFIDFNTFIDRGYLVPDRAFGPSDPPHPPVVPYLSL